MRFCQTALLALCAAGFTAAQEPVSLAPVEILPTLLDALYLPEEDALAQLAERIEREKDAELMPQLVHLVHAQAWRLRGWLELARLQQEVLRDAPAALRTLEKAMQAVREPEDVALLMCRAAGLCEKSLQDEAAARSWRQRAAEQYPDTVYGRKAASLLR